MHTPLRKLPFYVLLSLAACAGGDDGKTTPATVADTDTDTDSDTDSDSDTDTDSDTDADTDSDTDADTDSDADADADTDTGWVDPFAQRCAPLPAPAGPVVQVTPADDLESVLEGLTTGETAELAAGTYVLSAANYISLRTDGITIRGATGQAEDVVIDGGFEAPFGLSINASDVVVSDLTIRNIYYHPVHITPSDGRTITGVRLYRVRVIDGAEQAIKINTGGKGTLFADDGEVACSHLELTDAGRAQVRNNCYTGGIDMHQGRGWVFRDNHVEGFWCDSGLSEHGIHIWRGTRDTLIERNVLVDNARGIGLGLGNDSTGRAWADAPCGALVAQDYDAVVQNNMVVATDPRLDASASGFDVGIGLESACGADVRHNSVYSSYAPFSSIEYRFDPTTATIANNLMSHQLRDRGAGPMTLAGNVENVGADAFVDPASGDLHLAGPGTLADGAGDPAHRTVDDIDGEQRGSPPDVGADEL